jgi:hypothetical protein
MLLQKVDVDVGFWLVILIVMKFQLIGVFVPQHEIATSDNTVWGLQS